MGRNRTNNILAAEQSKGKWNRYTGNERRPSRRNGGFAKVRAKRSLPRRPVMISMPLAVWIAMRSKRIGLGRYRLRVDFDVYNVFNSSWPFTVSSTYSTAANSAWLKPTNVLQSRFFKLGGQLSF